ncbi:MAG: PAS domain S-box protein [bacterium]
MNDPEALSKKHAGSQAEQDVELSWRLRVDAALAELAEALISPLSIDDIADLVLRHARELTESRYGYVGYIQPGTGYLISPTMSRDVWEECNVPDKDIVFKEYKGMWGWVLHNRESILANRPDEDPRSTGVPEGHIPIKKFISVPALYKDELVGQISLANSSRDYTAKDLDLLQRLAAVYAVAINRKWSEETLKKSEAELSAILENAPILMMLLDQDTRIRKINAYAGRLTGRTPEEMKGMRGGEALRCLNSLEDPRGCGFGRFCRQCRVRRTVEETFGKKQRFHRIEAKLPVVSLEGDWEERDLLVSTTPLEVEGEEQVLVSLEDVTELKQAQKALRKAHDELEQKVQERTKELTRLNRELVREIEERMRAQADLRESERLYRNMFQKNDAAKLLINPEDGSIVDANEAAINFYGYPRETLLSMKISRINTAEADTVREKMKRAISGEQDFFIFNHRLATGEVRVVEVHSTPLEIKGKPILYSIIFDITERMETEQALNQAYFELDQIFQTAESGKRVVDTDYNVVRANDTLSRITGVPKEKMLGSKCYESFPGENCFTEKCTLKRVLAGEKISHLEISKKGTAGECMPCLLTALPFYDSSGNMVGIVEDFRDMTEQKRLESIAEAVNTMNNIGYVFSGIRHELGNPVNSIKTTLSVLKQRLYKFSRENIMEYVERSLQDLGRVEYLLRSLKNFSMYETLRSENLLVSFFLENFQAIIEEDVRKRKVKLHIKPGENPLWIYADARALQQVMLNLVTNALDALENRPDPWILISATAGEKLVDITVEDNGKGMDADQLRDVFKPFYTNKAHGTGMGMVIARKMMASMEGSLEMESKPEEGTKVMLRLPRSGEHTDA